MAALALAAGVTTSAGYGVFSYNRQNFMFDGKMLLEREYQGQKMRIKRFSLYREDIHDLIDLTISKMDNYLILNTIQLFLAIILFTEGKPQIHHGWPQRIYWLYALCNGGAILYFVLSVWLAMHASIAAHSFGVRLLTQFVRLPVPNRQQLDAARAQALDFEMKGGRDLFRIPVIGEQAQRIQRQVREGFGQEAGNSFESPQAQESRQRQESPGLSDPDEDTQTPTAQLRHIQVYRELQANWIGYDAYARVCMLMGINQFVHAITYYALGIFIVEQKNPLTGFGAACVFCAATWLVIKLDVYISSWKLLLAGSLFLLAPALETISVTISVCLDVRESVQVFSDCLGIPVFVIHIFWITFIVNLCRAEYFNGVALPKNFRSVTYLDVFGSLTKDSAGKTVPGSIIDVVSAEESAIGEDRDETPRRPRASETASDQARSLERQTRWSARPREGHRPMLPEMLTSLQGECQKLCQELMRDMVSWNSEKVRSMLGSESREAVAKIRSRLRSAEQSLEISVDSSTQTGTALPGNTGLPRAVSPESAKVWLRFEIGGRGDDSVEFYYCCESDETQWTRPQDPDRISDILIMQAELSILETKVQTYTSALPTAMSPTSSAFSSVRRHLASALPAARSRQGGGEIGSYESRSLATGSVLSGGTSVSAASSLFDMMDTHDFDESAAQEQLFGGAESEMAQPEYRHTFLNTGAQAGPTFYPQAPDSAQSSTARLRERHPPGMVPYRTFCQGSIVVIGVWILALVWNLFTIYGIVVPLVTNPDNNEIFSAPQLIFDHDWPHPFFRPTGLACHPAAGSVILIASKYAVYELRLDVLPAGQLRPALVQCLAGEPDFHASGIRDISLECPSADRSGSSVCTVLLLSSLGDRALRCSLDGSHAGAPVLLPRNRRWRALASSVTGTIWALGPEAFLELGHLHDGDAVDQLVPLSEISDEAIANMTQLHVLAAGEPNGGSVLALEAEGNLRAWPHQGGGPHVHKLPGGGSMRWSGLCTLAGSLYLASEGREHRPAGLWRMPRLDF